MAPTKSEPPSSVQPLATRSVYDFHVCFSNSVQDIDSSLLLKNMATQKFSAGGGARERWFVELRISNGAKSGSRPREERRGGFCRRLSLRFECHKIATTCPPLVESSTDPAKRTSLQSVIFLFRHPVVCSSGRVAQRNSTEKFLILKAAPKANRRLDGLDY